MKNTKEIIKKAFINLYINKSIEKIKITELIQEAHVSKSTFYKYYDNIEDILKDIKVTITTDMDKIYNDFNYIDLCDTKENVPAPNLYVVFKYILENKNFFASAFSEHGNYYFKVESKKNIISKLNKTYQKYFNKKEELNIFSEYICSCIYESCRILVTHCNSTTPKAMAIKVKKDIVDFINNKNIYFS